jgi:glycyl-tRNA synthetase beta chain
MVGADPALAGRGALLAKADLTTGMVGEFPELQGVMGGYYARHDNEDRRVVDAVREHYTPKGPGDPVPAEPVAVAVALADKIDQLAAFFAVGEVPTGSGDPFALRRAALGVIRIIRDNGLRLPLAGIFEAAGQDLPAPVPVDALLAFIADRLRVQLRADGARHDVLAAVFAAGADDDIVRLLARTDAVAEFLATPDGADLLSASRRAANILRIEDKRDGPHAGPVDDGLLSQPEERALAAALDVAEPLVRQSIEAERYADAMRALAGLRPPLDAFFDKVTVNAPDPALRRNRLRLLARVGAAMGRAADFSRIEGQEKA